MEEQHFLCVLTQTQRKDFLKNMSTAVALLYNRTQPKGDGFGFLALKFYNTYLRSPIACAPFMRIVTFYRTAFAKTFKRNPFRYYTLLFQENGNGFGPIL